MGLILKTTEELWFSPTNPPDATGKTLIAANTELAIVSCSVVGEALQLTLSMPMNGLSQGFIQASGIVSVSFPTASKPPKKQLAESEIAESVNREPTENEPESNH